MATEIRVPTLGESVTEATVGQWFKKVGDVVKADEPLVELETDKVTLEVPSPSAGVIGAINVEAGSTVAVGAILGAINADGKAEPVAAPTGRPDEKTDTARAIGAGPEPTELRKAETAPAPAAPAAPAGTAPSAAKILAEKGISADAVAGTGKDGRITKADALSARAEAPKPAPVRTPPVPDDASREERVRMNRLRQTIARRLKEAQEVAAMLTTFNEVDMTAVMALRSRYRDLFEKKHGVKLGFMGFFVKACVQALKEIPAVNAEIDGTDIVYKNYYHIGVAVSTERGLVVPVVRDADQLSIAEIEKTIAALAGKARDGSLSIEAMQGGTFTLTNGGIFGSLMSTPI
ncbi:MAG: 2-oxoglutarate dehydrogenase complex dihydrolipoyllysine-residue succinyltransferase, partial [Bauldia sp.]|nr:2-oxoglutarate dehydrogenase complex dihydrolipoyllysine-residue succinyltransferase [Bauldia sp.]